MSTFRNPVGPQSSSVYWRRRLVVGLGLLAVIVVIVLIVVGPGASKGEASKPKPTPTAASTPEAPTTPQECDADVVAITAVTNKVGFDADDKPELALAIENTGAVPCIFGVGADVQEYTITTGEQLVWSSKHCQAKAEPVSVTLEPAEKLDAEPIVWDRTKSSPDTCEGDRPVATAKGASYHLTVTVSGVKSKSQQFVLY